jgi:hypothetical protein
MKLYYIIKEKDKAEVVYRDSSSDIIGSIIPSPSNFWTKSPDYDTWSWSLFLPLSIAHRMGSCSTLAQAKAAVRYRLKTDGWRKISDKLKLMM